MCTTLLDLFIRSVAPTSVFYIVKKGHHIFDSASEIKNTYNYEDYILRNSAHNLLVSITHTNNITVRSYTEITKKRPSFFFPEAKSLQIIIFKCIVGYAYCLDYRHLNLRI